MVPFDGDDNATICFRRGKGESWPGADGSVRPRKPLDHLTPIPRRAKRSGSGRRHRLCGRWRRPLDHLSPPSRRGKGESWPGADGSIRPRRPLDHLTPIPHRAKRSGSGRRHRLCGRWRRPLDHLTPPSRRGKGVGGLGRTPTVIMPDPRAELRAGIVMGQCADDKRQVARGMRRRPTPAEAALWQRLRRSQLAGLHFRRQQVIDEFVVDFYCHARGLVVELDGPIHEQQIEHDAARDRALMVRGLTVLRFANARVLGDIEAVLAEIAAAT